MTNQDVESALETAYAALSSIKNHDCFRFDCDTKKEIEAAINHINEAWARAIRVPTAIRRSIS